ncbi:hypothetical protein HYH03_000866 [Edaphochlamys debaryana]|uniref:Uncharacterized protein n=1 Tax=Edaphochlamys debaryana TaxID=47281 RepID=A0A835YDQ9_9CHLO|nr:hypothetical protein HYH03_000866 [Edaphochlamys debaryana]|eukprot:KAG2501047.1 hypothetical protein HYH03_000866 [Edaphochlamys debaryana]
MRAVVHAATRALPAIREAIRQADFVAIDTEFTGLFPDGVFGDDFLDDFEERYKKLHASANSFIISQFGLAAFRWCPASPGSVGPTRAGHWEVRTFNAYVFPRPVAAMNWDKRFVCQASSLTYLAAQGFDFNRMIRDGIGYIPLQGRNARLASMRAELQGSGSGSGSASGSESGSATGSVEPRTPGEEAAVAGWRERVRSWLLGSDPELELPLPGLRRRRHLLRRLVQSEFQLPSLGLDPFTWDEDYGSGERADGGGGGRRQRGGRGGGSAAASAGSVDLQLTSSYEAEDEEAGSSGGDGSDADGDGEGEGQEDAVPLGVFRLRRLGSWEQMGSGNVQLTPRQRLELLEEQSGFSQVLEALRDSRKPVVAHNAAFDLAYTLHQFFGPLPRTWAEYKSALGRAFPGGVYDTKHIAVQLASSYGLQLGDTSLGGLYGTVVDEQWLRNSGLAARRSASGLGPHEILHAPGFGSYDGITDIASKAHEAGFDAFMTGCAFARLLRVAEVRSAKHAAAVAAVGSTGSSSSSGVGPDAAASSSGSLGAAAAESDGAAAAAAAAASTSGSDGAGEALLVPLTAYRGRIHMNRSDLPYANLYGSDPVTNRPAVVHMSGLTANTRAGFVVARFADMGIGPVIVSMLGAGDGGRHIGALVQLPNAEMVPRVLQSARTKWKSWNIQTYADYQRAKRQQQQQQQQQQHKGERGEGGGPVSRAPPREISGGAGTRAATAAPAPATAEQQAGADARAAGSASGTDAASTSGSGPAAAAAAGSVAAAAGAVAGASERERLKAFAQVVAVAAASVPPKPAGGGDAGTATDAVPKPEPQPEPQPETAGRSDGAALSGAAAAARGPQAEAEAGKEPEAQAGPSSGARPAQPASPFANGADRASGIKPVPGSTAAREAAERLRRLAGTSGIGGGGGAAPGRGGGGAGAGGLSLQRPGRPKRG